MGIRPAPSRPTSPRASARLITARTLSEPKACCVRPIDQTKMADSDAAYIDANRSMSAREVPERRSSSSKGRSSSTAESSGKPAVCSAMKASSRPPVRREGLHHPGDERDVAADVDREELVGHAGAEHRALSAGGDPVALEAGLAERVDHRHPGALPAGEVEVLHDDGLRVGDVGSEQHDEVGLHEVRVGDRGGAGADHRAQRGGGGRVADARGVVDVVGAEETRHLAGRVVDLVRDPPGGHVEREPRSPGRPDAPGDQVQRLVPGHAREPRLARPPHHRIRQPAHVAQLGRRPAPQRRDVAEQCVVHLAHRVDLEQAEARRAQVDAVDGPVVQPGHAESAAVAHTLAQDARGVGQGAPVLPHHLQHVEVVVGFRQPDPVGAQAHPQVAAAGSRARHQARIRPGSV